MSAASELLAARRNDVQLSKAELARRLSPTVSIQFIYNVEKGKTPIPMERAPQWCSLIDLPLDVLAEALTVDYSAEIRGKLGCV